MVCFFGCGGIACNVAVPEPDRSMREGLGGMGSGWRGNWRVGRSFSGQLLLSDLTIRAHLKHATSLLLFFIPVSRYQLDWLLQISRLGN